MKRKETAKTKQRVLDAIGALAWALEGPACPGDYVILVGCQTTGQGIGPVILRLDQPPRSTADRALAAAVGRWLATTDAQAAKSPVGPPPEFIETANSLTRADLLHVLATIEAVTRPRLVSWSTGEEVESGAGRDG